MEGNSVLFIYHFIYFFMRNEHVFECILDPWTSYSKTRNEIQQKGFVFYMVTFLPHIYFN